MTVPADDAGAQAASAHRAFATAAFNAAWELIDLPERTPEQDRRMLTLAFAARWHWGEVGTDDNVAISDWQVAHVASLAGEPALAMSFARSAYDIARSGDMPAWLRASTAEGRARACAASGDRDGYDRYAAETRDLLDTVEEDEDRALIRSQLATIHPPQLSAAGGRPTPHDPWPERR